jgi:hypothetical protein
MIAVIAMADVMGAQPNGLLTSPVLTLEVAGGGANGSLGTSTAEGGRSVIPAAA